MNVFDTNAVLRYILQDNTEMADHVESLMLQEKYEIPIEVLAEVIHVLEKVYKIDRQQIERELTITINEPNAVIPHHNVIKMALQLYGSVKLDFVDCILIGYEKIEGYKVISFDKKLNKQLER